MLVHNKPIKRRSFSVDTYNELIDIKYRFWKKTPRYDTPKKSPFVDSPVQNYNLWFHYLKLLLEMEEKGLKFTKERDIDNEKTVIDSSIVGKDIELKRTPYTGWDFDLILTQSFSKWWKTHKFLFGSSDIIEMSEPSDWIEYTSMTHIRVDTRRSEKEIIKKVKEIIKKKKNKDIQQFTVIIKSVNLRYDWLVFNYNVMVRHLNGEKPLEIFLNEKNRFRTIRERYGLRYFNKRSGIDIWGTYINWWKVRQEPEEEKVTKTNQVKTNTKKVKTYSDLLKNQLESQVEKLVKNIVLETQDILLGVCEGSFVKKIKYTFDPKTGKRGLPKL